MESIAIVSGGFDPVHRGHLKLIQEASKYGKVIVILNRDEFLEKKHKTPLLPVETRIALVQNLKKVHWAMYDNLDEDDTVNKALERIREEYPDAKMYFCNGGDRRSEDDIPEKETCKRLGIEMVFGVGGDKEESSSEIIRKYLKNIKDELETLNGTAAKIDNILTGMKSLLLYKNKKYGDSALKPINVFFKGDATDSILIRLDDKVSRVKNNPDPIPRVNDIADIIGYCTLLLIIMDVDSEQLKQFED